MQREEMEGKKRIRKKCLDVWKKKMDAADATV